QVIAILCRRGADFSAAEDAVQEALVEFLKIGDASPPEDIKGWLVTVAWRKYLDGVRADSARRDREKRADIGSAPGRAPATDDTLDLYFLCAHPSLTTTSAVALTDRKSTRLNSSHVSISYAV